jgi:hypothetical protein
VATFGTAPRQDRQGLLVSAGIDASICGRRGGAYPFVLSGGAQLLVDENDVEAATQVLASETDKS